MAELNIKRPVLRILRWLLAGILTYLAFAWGVVPALMLMKRMPWWLQCVLVMPVVGYAVWRRLQERRVGSGREKRKNDYQRKRRNFTMQAGQGRREYHQP